MSAYRGGSGPAAPDSSMWIRSSAFDIILMSAVGLGHLQIIYGR